jgi:hypothetical protein
MICIVRDVFGDKQVTKPCLESALANSEECCIYLFQYESSKPVAYQHKLQLRLRSAYVAGRLKLIYLRLLLDQAEQFGQEILTAIAKRIPTLWGVQMDAMIIDPNVRCGTPILHEFFEVIAGLLVQCIG